MQGTLQFLVRHWRSAVLIAGAVVAVFIVYRNRSKYIPDEDNQP
jgi:hypothetical protein